MVVGCALTSSPPIVEVDGTNVEVVVHGLDHMAGAAPGVGSQVIVDATIDHVQRRYDVAARDDVVTVDSPLGAASFRVIDRLPPPTRDGDSGSQVAPMPGSVVRVLVDIGCQVRAGDPLVVLEAMKMEHSLVSPHAGVVVAIHAKEGDQVERGAVLVAVEPHT